MPNRLTIIADAAKRTQRAAHFALLVVMFATHSPQTTLGRDRFAAVRLDSGLTVVPFAVPVATPVAVVGPSQAFYAYAPQVHATSSDAAADNEIDSQLRAEFEAFRRWRKSQAAASAADAVGANATPDASPLVSANCLRCHAGANAKGDIRFDGELTNDQRLAAIRAALSGEMPKGKPLSADVLGPLLYELSQPSLSASSPSFPVPGE